MSQRSVMHDVFTIERVYPVRPTLVFAAFTSSEAKTAWGDTGHLEVADQAAASAEFDFRVGGAERFGVKIDGTAFRYDARYYDIVPDQRIVYAYEMYAGDIRISVSVATIQFESSDGGTLLRWTEQGAYLDGADGPSASSLREGGTGEMLDGLGRYLAGSTAS